MHLRREEHEAEGVVRRPLDLSRRWQQRRIEDEAPHLLGERGAMPTVTVGARAAYELTTEAVESTSPVRTTTPLMTYDFYRFEP